MHKQNFIEIHTFILKIMDGGGGAHFLHKSRTITLLFLNEISLFPIPYYSFPISVPMQSFKKIGQKVQKLEHRNKALTDRTDGRMDRWTDTQAVWRV